MEKRLVLGIAPAELVHFEHRPAMEKRLVLGIAPAELVHFEHRP